MPFVEIDLHSTGTKELYYLEGLFSDAGQWYKVEEILFRDDRRCIFATRRLGNVYVIDTAVQVAGTRDAEAPYHEMAHWVANACIKTPETALVIGCDGGMLRELCTYTCLKKITAVDISQTSVEKVQELIPSVPGGSWSDERVELVVMDGARFAEDMKEKGIQFDLIIVDSPDPIGEAKSLFTPKFNHDLAAILSPDGVLLRQTGSSFMQPDEMPANYWKMKTAFPKGSVQVLVTAVPIYFGGYFTFVAASHCEGIFEQALEGVERRFAERIDPAKEEALRWYSPAMQRAAMVLPAGLERDLENLAWGSELLLDLYGCNFLTITSPEKIAEFKKMVCGIIGMKTYGDVVVTPDFGEEKTRTAGLSALQWIETSSLVSHYAKHLLIAFQDIFTCASLESEKAVKFAMEFFEAAEAFWLVWPRGRKNPQPEPEVVVHKTVGENGEFMTSDFPFALDHSRIRTYKM